MLLLKTISTPKARRNGHELSLTANMNIITKPSIINKGIPVVVSILLSSPRTKYAPIKIKIVIIYSYTYV